MERFNNITINQESTEELKELSVNEFFDIMKPISDNHIKIEDLEEFLKNKRLIEFVRSNNEFLNWFIDDIKFYFDLERKSKNIISGEVEKIDQDLEYMKKYFFHFKNITIILEKIIGKDNLKKIPILSSDKNFRRLDDLISKLIVVLLEKLSSRSIEYNDDTKKIKNKICDLKNYLDNLFPEKLKWSILIDKEDGVNKNEEGCKSILLSFMENRKMIHYFSPEEMFCRILYFLNSKEFNSKEEVSNYFKEIIQSDPEIKEMYIQKYFMKPISERFYALNIDYGLKDVLNFIDIQDILNHKDLDDALEKNIKHNFDNIKESLSEDSETDPLGVLISLYQETDGKICGELIKEKIINKINNDSILAREVDFVIKRSQIQDPQKLEYYDLSFFINLIKTKNTKYTKEDFMYFLENFTNNSQDIKGLESIFKDCLLDEDLLILLNNDFLNEEHTPKSLCDLLKKHNANGLIDILDRYKKVLENVLENASLYDGFTQPQLFQVVENGKEKELETILKKKNNEKELLEFRFANVFEEKHKEIFDNLKKYLEGRSEEYKIFIDNWKNSYLLENPDKKDSDFYSYISTLNYVKPEKFNSLDILYKYLPKNKSFENEYHIPLEKISNLELFSKFQIQDLYQLFAVLVPNSNPNDFGKDKYEILGTLIDGYLSEDFLQNVVQHELTEEEKKTPSYVVDIVNLKNGKSSEIVSEIFHEKGYYRDFLTLFKITRMYSSFTKEHHKLQELKEKNLKIYQYFEDLLTHESASIDGLKSLLTKPKEFFSKKSSYTDELLQQSLNPNNWCEISDYRLNVSMDLSQEDIRDIDISGKLDSRSFLNTEDISIERKAVLTTAKKAELIGKNKENLELLKNNLKEYLINNFNKETIEKVINIIFSNYESLKQELNLNFDINNKFLLNRLKKLIEDETLILNDKYKNIFNNLEDLSCLDLYQKIIELLDEKDLTSIKQEEIDRLQDFSNIGSNLNIVGKFLRFDDYRRATVGNDTGSCDSFSDGKRTLYNFNPSCFQFSVSFEEQDIGKTRRNVIFQSLVTIDYDVKDKEILNKIKEGVKNGNLSEKLGKDFLERFYANTKPIICFDNIEGNKNFRDKIVLKDSHLGEIYIEAFKELTKQNLHINQDYFIVGKTSLNDSSIDSWLGSKDDADNNFIPSTLLSYIDNHNGKSHRIDVIDNSKEKQKQIRQNGVFSIDYLDSIPCMYLEDEIHQSHEKEGGVAMQNLLIGSHYSFIKNNIDNLNVGYFDKKGILRGYALAYPAINTKTQEKCIYIHDLAVEEEYRDKAGSLVVSFMKNIVEQVKKILKESNQERIEIKAHTNKFSSKLLEHKDLAKKFDIKIENEVIYIEK